MENYSWPWDLSTWSAAPPCWSSKERKASCICLLCLLMKVSHSLNPDGICIFSGCIWGQRAAILAFRFYHAFSDLRKNEISKHICIITSHSPFSSDLITLQFKSEAAKPNEMDQWKRTLWPQDTRGVPHQSVLRGRLIALLGLPRWSLFWFPDFFYLFSLRQPPPHTLF